MIKNLVTATVLSLASIGPALAQGTVSSDPIVKASMKKAQKKADSAK